MLCLCSLDASSSTVAVRLRSSQVVEVATRSKDAPFFAATSTADSVAVAVGLVTSLTFLLHFFLELSIVHSNNMVCAESASPDMNIICYILRNFEVSEITIRKREVAKFALMEVDGC